MATYSVVLPIAGHVWIDVEADSEEAAIEKALEDCTRDHIEEWEAMRKLNEGNVCHCPQPWEAEAILQDDN